MNQQSQTKPPIKAKRIIICIQQGSFLRKLKGM
jgi:hypothetical protein